MKRETGKKPEVIVTEEPKQVEFWPEVTRINPRLVFANPDVFFGRDLYHDLLMEQQEQM